MTDATVLPARDLRRDLEFGDALLFLDELGRRQLRLAEDVGAQSRRGRDALGRASALAYAREELARLLEEAGRELEVEVPADWDRTCDARR